MNYYKQLSLKERFQIDALNEVGWKCAALARRLGRHRSTISRELKRNTPATQRYTRGSAHLISSDRRRCAYKSSCKNRSVIHVVRTLLRQSITPF